MKKTLQALLIFGSVYSIGMDDHSEYNNYINDSVHQFDIEKIQHQKIIDDQYTKALNDDYNQYFFDETNGVHFNNNHSLIKHLINEGANISLKDYRKRNLHKFTQRGVDKLAYLLIEKGADVNQKDEEGMTPLFSAAIHINHKLVEKIIELGADINAQDNEGNTALNKIIYFVDGAIENRTIDLIELLIHSGANPYLTNHAGQNAFMITNEATRKNLEEIYESFQCRGIGLK